MRQILIADCPLAQLADADLDRGQAQDAAALHCFGKNTKHDSNWFNNQNTAANSREAQESYSLMAECYKTSTVANCIFR